MDPAELNPYAAPRENRPRRKKRKKSRRLVLAGRGDRFIAAVVDGLLNVFSVAPGLLLAMFGFENAEFLGMFAGQDPGQVEGAVVVFFAIVNPLIGLNAYQPYLIATSGQTIGKNWQGIQIVRMDGSAPGFLWGVVVRSWLFGVVEMIPYMGCLGLVDVLFIFSEERRCLHDRLAGTKVVVART